MKIILQDFYVDDMHVDELVADMPHVSALEDVTINDVISALEEQVDALFE